MRHRYLLPASALAFLATPFSSAIQGPEEDTYVDPYGSMTTPLGGSAWGDAGALPVPAGSLFFQPSGHASAGRSDEELEGVSGIDPLAGDLFDRVYHVEHEDGLWMRGRTFKAHAAASGFTYIPFLGSGAPQNYPVTFRLASATLAGEPLDLSEGATVTRDGDQIVLDRGPVDVVYEVALEQVEQLFFADVAGADGDLVLTLDVTSELRVSEAGAGFRFDGAYGGMGYGAAVVLDGSGKSANVPVAYEDGTLRLTVPASFLAQAEGQIVVDPVMNTFVVDSTGGDQREVDVAYDLNTDEYTFVYEDTFSGNDADIYMRAYTASGAFVSGRLVFGNNLVWRTPSVANLNANDVNLVVASVTNVDGDQEIRGRIYDIAANTFGAELLIGSSLGGATDNIRPDVGGNSSGAVGGVFMVVWERNYAPDRTLGSLRRVEADGTLGFNYVVELGDDVLHQEVVISESTGDAATVNRWNVVWRNQNLLTNQDTIRGIQLNAAGFLATGPSQLYEAPVGQRLREIDVSDALAINGFDPTYLATFDNYSGPCDEATILVLRNSVLRRLVPLADAEHADPCSRQDVQLGATFERFIATYHQGFTGDVFASVIDIQESSRIGIAERRSLLGSTANSNLGGAAIATRFSGGLVSRFAGIGWSYNDAIGGDIDAAGVAFTADTPVIPIYHFCRSLPNSTGDYGFLSMTGSDSVATSKSVTASNLPLNQFGLLLVGTQVVNSPMIGGSQGTLCVSGQFGRYNSQINSSGATGSIQFSMNPMSIPSPFGPVVAVAGQRFYWQMWHRDVVGGGATSNLTNAMGLLFQ